MLPVESMRDDPPSSGHASQSQTRRAQSRARSPIRREIRREPRPLPAPLWHGASAPLIQGQAHRADDDDVGQDLAGIANQERPTLATVIVDRPLVSDLEIRPSDERPPRVKGL